MSKINVTSPTAGTVWKIEMNAGDKIEEDDVIMILEAMKMEIPISADVSGTLSEILASEKDQINEDQIVAVIETGGNGS